jgi:NTE family protein
MPRPRIGLALGSGSARGWSHIGVINALNEAGLEPDIIAGCSMGALIGAAYVTGRLAALTDFAQSLKLRDYGPLLDVGLADGGLVAGKQIVAWLHRLGVTGAIEHCAKPFVAIATDLETGGEVQLHDGPIEQAVRASISLPGIFSPAHLGGRYLVDGGLVNPVPVSAARALGADIVIAVNLNANIMERVRRGAAKANAGKDDPAAEFLRGVTAQIPLPVREQIAAVAAKLLRPGPGNPGYFNVLTGSIYIMQHEITRSRLAAHPPQIMLAPKLSHIRLLEFYRAAEAIDEGYACMKEALPALRDYL